MSRARGGSGGRVRVRPSEPASRRRGRRDPRTGPTMAAGSARADRPRRPAATWNPAPREQPPSDRRARTDASSGSTRVALGDGDLGRETVPPRRPLPRRAPRAGRRQTLAAPGRRDAEREELAPVPGRPRRARPRRRRPSRRRRRPSPVSTVGAAGGDEGVRRRRGSAGAMTPARERQPVPGRAVDRRRSTGRRSTSPSSVAAT